MLKYMHMKYKIQIRKKVYCIYFYMFEILYWYNNEFLKILKLRGK